MEAPRRALFLAAGGLLALLPAAARDEPLPGGDFQRDVVAFLERHCYHCHDEQARKGGLVLARYREAGAALAEPEEWQWIRERVSAGEMPPPGRSRPAADETQRFLAWIDGAFALDAAAAAAPFDPGRPVLRRLNHVEYRNTIRDLFGLDFPAPEEFPAEPVGFGFDNVGAALSIPDILLEKYWSAAERIAERAILAEDPSHPPVRRYDGATLDSRAKDGEVAALHRVEEAAARHHFPRAGSYLLRARAWGQQAGPEACQMALRLDGATVWPFEVTATRAAPQVYEARAEIAAGPHAVAARFLNDYYNPGDPDPANRDRNLMVEWLEVVGPLDPPPLPRFQLQLYQRFGPELGARRKIAMLEHLATRVWRRPPSPAEIRRLDELAPAGAGLEEGLQIAVAALLASPNFLFRFEFDERAAGSGAIRELNDWELAVRLSYFLWSTTPDQQLLAVAERGELRRPPVLRTQLERLLAHPRARALADNFAAQWLQIRNLERSSVDPARFPAFTAELREAMAGETLALFEAVLREDRSVWELLEADFSFVNETLARHYGLAGVSGPALRRVSLAGTPRRGLLGHAAVLTVTSNPTRTSPVKRGKWVYENLLGAPPPAPPPGAGALDESAAAAGAASLRARLEQHRRDPSCAACHDSLDPIGFGLENYDPIGAWRESDQGFAIDSSGVLPDGRGFSGPHELVAVLRQERAFVRCLLEKLYVYALGRGLERSDRPILDAIEQGLTPGRPTLKQMIHGIVYSDAFLKRRAEG